MGKANARPVMALVSGIGDYQMQVITGITRRLDEAGMPVLVVAVDISDSDATPNVVLDLIRTGSVQGMIALADPSVLARPELISTLADAELPVVTLGTRFGEFPCVRGDESTGMRALMDHLLDECGARRLVVVRGVRNHADSLTRERILREECARRGIDVDEGLVVDGQFCSKPAYDAMRDLLGRSGDVDAVVAFNDPSAFGALSALTDHGLGVPEDVLLTGFDNIQESATSWPTLTTVDQRLTEQGECAASALLEMLAGASSVADVEVPATVLRRASTSRSVPPDRVLASARALQARVTLQELAVQISWNMANCRTISDVAAALEPCLAQLGVRRCFLALDEPDGAGTARAGPTARLAFTYRDGHVETVPSDPFRCPDLLPPALRPELADGNLLLQPLSIEGRERGYLLFDLNTENHVLTEALRIELTRTVDTVFSSRELKDRATMMERLVTRRTRELERANVELRRSVMRDGLTGIANRRAFEDFMTRAFGPDGPGDVPIGLLMVDVDLFKAYNDRYGHLAGDDALKTVADCLRRSVRSPHDLACRYGGEEFAVVVPGTAIDGALDIAQRFARLLAEAAIPHERSPFAGRVTASIGAAAAMVRESGPAELVAAADAALYRAKAEGRDRIVTAATGDRRGVPHPRTVVSDTPSADDGHPAHERG